jgi:sporulation protein YlmC with PRC-barrel domain
MAKRSDGQIQKHVLVKLSKRLLSGAAIVGFAAAIFFGVGSANAGVAGSSTIGVTTEELKVVAVGWSAKKKILGKAVYNDNKQKIGVVDDLIIAPDRSVTYAIIGVGGFVGVGKHDVAIPVNQLKVDQDRIILPGGTKDALKALPKFAYAK